MTRRAHRHLVAIASLAMSCCCGQSLHAQAPGGCNEPAANHAGKPGCYFTASQPLASIPSGPAYWHLYNYPTRAAAEADKGPNGTIVESFGKIWLYTIAEHAWRPAGGERVAVIGPFAVAAGKQYTARYMEAVFTPGMRAAIHRHSGPEAFYLLSGTQCLETPDGITITRAGEGAVVPEGPPMALSSVGTELRRSVVFVLHDPAEPWITMVHDWHPTGACPK